MKHYILLFAALTIAGLLRSNAQTTTTYVRKYADATLRLDWRTSNYGTVKWQKSTDGGATWTDETSATGREVTVKRVRSAVSYRVTVVGDEACKPIVRTYNLQPVDITFDITTPGSHSLAFEATLSGLPAEEIVEYGLCRNVSSLYRAYDLSYSQKAGTTPSTTEALPLVCDGLRPGTEYTVRPYFKLRSGSVIYGPIDKESTFSGIEWSSEDWNITTTSVTPRMVIRGYDNIVSPKVSPKVTMKFGTKDIAVTSPSKNVFTTVPITGLKPGTAYTMSVTADIDGEYQTIEKTVTTRTDYSSWPVETTVPPVAHKIVWDEASSRVQVSPDNIQAEYPRFLRVSEDTLLLAYHGDDGTSGSVDYWQNIYLQRSTDNGKTWSKPVKLLDHSMSIDNMHFWRFCNPELTRLKNGWILMPFIANANPETNDNCQVMLMTSRDGGLTWSDPMTVGRGRTWEPQIVQLPGGELELLVSSEAEWWQNGKAGNQEILCARSTDNGQTWTSYVRASYNPGKRDGMPCAVVLDGNRGIAFSEECVNDSKSPYVVHRSLDGEWDASPWDGRQDDDRWLCDRLGFFGGAPYMIKLATGEVVLSAHGNQNGSVWQTGLPRVVIGDASAHNFESRTLPIKASDLTYGEGAYYNSLFLKDDTTIWLGITHSRYNGSERQKSTIEYLEGKIVEK